MQGIVIAVSLSAQKGQPKENQGQIRLVENYGVENDAHAGDPVRQVSLLAMESIQKIKDLGLDVAPGRFAENITTSKLEIWNFKVGDTLKIGSDVILQISQIGKVCHSRCAIYQQVGDCVMPREGIFAVVLKGGIIKPADVVFVLKSSSS